MNVFEQRYIIFLNIVKYKQCGYSNIKVFNISRMIKQKEF